MANRPVHLKWALAAGGVVTALSAQGLPPEYFWAETLGGISAAGVTGLLPDWLEPAFTPMHRGFAHSLTAAGLLTQVPFVQARDYCRGQAAAWRDRAVGVPLGSDERHHAERQAWWWHFAAGACVAAPVGYAMHLLLDAGTPRSLPPF